MNTDNKRKDTMEDDKTAKRVKKECSYGERCYRRNPAHFREFSHPHLESILDSSNGGGDYKIPEHLHINRHMIQEQLEVIKEKQLYTPKNEREVASSSTANPAQSATTSSQTKYNDTSTSHTSTTSTKRETISPNIANIPSNTKDVFNTGGKETAKEERDKAMASVAASSKAISKGSDYNPIIPPTRQPEAYLKVVLPRGKMAAKHAASAPYHIFYTTIADSKDTHRQPYSITFLEILDSSLGELKCSLQINFMVEIAWLLAQYYFAGYSGKKLTILYGDESDDLKTINKKKPNVDAHYVSMATPFGKHHTKMMILCYEDGSLRVVVSTANLYHDDWENRTQGLWFSPRCPELPDSAMPHDGESPTYFKKSLLKYLNHYHMPQLSYYVERVKRCDFSHINVFLVASAPGGHFDQDWGLTRIGSLLRQHCAVPVQENRQWPLVAQASSLGSYGKDPKLWLTGDFLHHFTKIKDQSQLLSTPPELKLIYPSLENVQQSHDGLLGGGCLPYSGEVHAKQDWLNRYLYQWRATHTRRDQAMPHIKSYTRVDPDASVAAFFLLTSANVSKAAWGQINKGNAALRIMSYEAGVLFLPKFLINEDFFPLKEGATNRLIIPYDLPPTRYTEKMSPWISDYLGLC